MDGRISANRDVGAAPSRSSPSLYESRRTHDPGPACARNTGGDDGITLHIHSSIDLKSCRANKVEGPFVFIRWAPCAADTTGPIDHIVAIGRDEPRHPEATPWRAVRDA